MPSFNFFNGVDFLNQLNLQDEDALNPLQLSLLSFKCCEMGFATRSVEFGAKDHTSFITSLLTHPVLKKTAHDNLPNGLSPLDIAQRFELHHIATLIERAGGRPGVWTDVPQVIQIKHHLAVSRLKDAYASMKAIAEDGEYGIKFIKGVFSSVIKSKTVEREVQTDSWLTKEQDGVWADICIPQEIELRYPLALRNLKEAYASMQDIAGDGEHGPEFIRGLFSSVLRLKTAEVHVQTDSYSLLAKEQDSLWHPNAAIVGADVGSETDEHEYKSLMVPADKSKKPPPMRPCKDTSEVLKKVVDHIKEINAMLNHHTGGTVHFGIQDEHNTVEEGLDLPQAVVIYKLQTRVSQLLQEFYPAVQSHFVTIQPVQLMNSTLELTGRWRFDICVNPHNDVVHLSHSLPVAYYRQGGNSVLMPTDVLRKRLKLVSMPVSCVE